MPIESFDKIYDENDAFEDVYEEITEQLLSMAKEHTVTYVVPGHPLVAERTVQLLIEKERVGLVQLDIAGGNSFLDAIFGCVTY